MNRLLCLVALSWSLLACLADEATARGGGGMHTGGGIHAGMRPGGGMSHGAAVNRTPSMSRLPAQRPQTLPAFPNTGNTWPGTLPGNISTGLPGQTRPGARPGQISTGLPGQWPNQWPNQWPGQTPNWNTGQRPGQLPNWPGGQRPGQLPDWSGGQRPGQFPNTNLGQQLPVHLPGQLPGDGTWDNIHRPGQGNRPGNIHRPGGRPTVDDVHDFLNLPGGITTLPARPGGGSIGRPGSNFPNTGWHEDWSRPRGGRWEQIAGSPPERWLNRQNIANQVRDRWNRRYPNHNIWFNHHFWVTHPHLHWHFHPGFNYWNHASWVTLTAWMPYAWGEPIYYDFGSGGNIYYRDGTVYVDDQPTYTSEEFAQQASQIAGEVPDDLNAEDIEWLPLGVFAVMPDRGQATDPTMFLQLAVSREGVIGGTFQNTLKDSAESVQGRVDPETQRAAWHVIGRDLPVMETGINNLTRDETNALVHFDGGVTQQWLLVRLNPDE